MTCLPPQKSRKTVVPIWTIEMRASSVEQEGAKRESHAEGRENGYAQACDQDEDAEGLSKAKAVLDETV